MTLPSRWKAENGIVRKTKALLAWGKLIALKSKISAVDDVALIAMFVRRRFRADNHRTNVICTKRYRQHIKLELFCFKWIRMDSYTQ